MEIIFLVVWLFFGLMIAIMASNRGHSGALWFLYGFLIWPIAFLHILLTPATADAQRSRQLQSGRLPCPFCAEPVLREAKICAHCRSTLPESFGQRLPAEAPVAPEAIQSGVNIGIWLVLGVVVLVVAGGAIAVSIQ